MLTSESSRSPLGVPKDKPETMTAEEVCALFGIKFGTWRTRQYTFHKTGKGQMPQPIEGGPYGQLSVYKTSDILDVRDKVSFEGKTSKAPKTPSEAPSKEKTFNVDNWPAGVPRDNNEMIKVYGEVIMSEIYKRNVVKGNADDHFQEVCLKLISARVLEKFVQRVLNTTHEDKPETMTAEDACTLFGIRFSAWRTRQYAFHKTKKGWMPQPIEGGPYGPHSVYKTSDILDVPDKAPFKRLAFHVDAWPVRAVAPHHFQAYLLRAVRNHFFNACRTIIRKHKDRPGDCFGSNFHDADGQYNENWEDLLPDNYATASIEASTLLSQKMGLLHDITNQMPEPHRLEIFDLLSKNHTIPEIVKLVTLSSENEYRLLKLCEA